MSNVPDNEQKNGDGKTSEEEDIILSPRMNIQQNDQQFRTLLEYLQKKVGSEPNDAIGWMYVARSI